MEQKLADLKYDTGKVDGVFDAATGHAVMAFQKESGLERSAKATPAVLEAIAEAGEPGPMMAYGGGNRVEIDLKRQVLHALQGRARWCGRCRCRPATRRSTASTATARWP